MTLWHVRIELAHGRVIDQHVRADTARDALCEVLAIHRVNRATLRRWDVVEAQDVEKPGQGYATLAGPTMRAIRSSK